MRAVLFILVLLFCWLARCATGRPLPEVELEMPNTLTERCAGNRALGCYLRGLSFAKDASTGEQRHEAVGLISEACAANIEAACETLKKRLKPPRRIAGRAFESTREAWWLHLQGQILVKCILTEEGVLRDCRIDPPTSEEERNLLAESNVEKEAFATFDTWRFKPALFDDRPFPFDFVWQLDFHLTQRQQH